VTHSSRLCARETGTALALAATKKVNLSAFAWVEPTAWTVDQLAYHRAAINPGA
jgi:hypothetical protein